MALTKVRLPVADIAAISDGTSNVTVEGSGGDVTVDVAGVNIGTFSATGLDLGALNLDAGVVEASHVHVDDGTVHTHMLISGTEGAIGTSTAHALGVYANAIKALTVETDGQVQLGVEGTATNHLVTKSYVDGASGVTPASLDTNGATSGHFIIPGTTDSIIVNWGITAPINSASGATGVTFDEPFPNSFLIAVVSRNIASVGADNAVNWANGSTTGMDVYQTGSAVSPVSYIAIGY